VILLVSTSFVALEGVWNDKSIRDSLIAMCRGAHFSSPSLLPMLALFALFLPLACGGPAPPMAGPVPVAAPVAAGATPPPGQAPPGAAVPTTAAEKRRAFADAAELVDDGRCREALPLLEILLRAYPEMEDYHLHHLGRCAAALGDFRGATDAWAQLLARHGQSIHAEATALAWGHQLQAVGDDGGAEPLLRRAAAAEDAELASAARLDLAAIALARGEIRAAYGAFAALREDDSGEVAAKARSQVLALRDRYPELAPRSAAERESEARLRLREGDNAAALRLVDDLLATAPAADQPRLLRLRALVYLGSGDTDAYIGTLREIGRRFPAEGQQVLFEEARWLWNRDRNAEAREAFLDLEHRYPRHPRIATARYALARIAQDAGDEATALRRFATVIDRHPRSELARESRWQTAWIHYHARRWDAAERQFAHLGRNQDATYWRARTLENSGRAAAARGLYEQILERSPDSYYAIRAAERLGEARGGALAGVRARPAPFPALPTALANDYHLSRARELHAAGLNGYARREVRVFSRDNPRQPRDFMLDLYRAVDAHRSAIRLVAGESDLHGETLYPLAFWDLVVRNADRYRIDPVLVVALMRQESLFDPEALSPANARGLMQLLPTTAEAVAGRMGRGGRIDLYDPATNIELGVAHLRELADQYAGDHVRILAAYNAGAGAVSSWDRRYGNRASDEYVESITYRETRDYVKKVLANYRKYQRMYGA
jgi:soluble lytic murein transglycosylase